MTSIRTSGFLNVGRDAPAQRHLSAHDARTTAAELVKQDIIRERLNGDERLWKRWAANNGAYLEYRTTRSAIEADQLRARCTAEHATRVAKNAKAAA